MTRYGFDYEWCHDLNDGMGGWRIFPHVDEEQEHADFIKGLHAKDKGGERKAIQALMELSDELGDTI